MAERPPCSMCSKPVPPRAENAAFPFCSARCQLADLSHWLDGNYRLSEPAHDVDFGAPSESDYE